MLCVLRYIDFFTPRAPRELFYKERKRKEENFTKREREKRRILQRGKEKRENIFYTESTENIENTEIY